MNSEMTDLIDMSAVPHEQSIVAKDADAQQLSQAETHAAQAAEAAAQAALSIHHHHSAASEHQVQDQQGANESVAKELVYDAPKYLIAPMPQRLSTQEQHQQQQQQQSSLSVDQLSKTLSESHQSFPSGMIMMMDKNSPSSASGTAQIPPHYLMSMMLRGGSNIPSSHASSGSSLGDLAAVAAMASSSQKAMSPPGIPSPPPTPVGFATSPSSSNLKQEQQEGTQDQQQHQQFYSSQQQQQAQAQAQAQAQYFAQLYALQQQTAANAAMPQQGSSDNQQVTTADSHANPRLPPGNAFGSFDNSNTSQQDPSASSSAYGSSNARLYPNHLTTVPYGLLFNSPSTPSTADGTPSDSLQLPSSTTSTQQPPYFPLPYSPSPSPVGVSSTLSPYDQHQFQQYQQFQLSHHHALGHIMAASGSGGVPNASSTYARLQMQGGHARASGTGGSGRASGSGSGKSGRVYKCTRPNCSKVYKNSNGLKYHMDKGSCELEVESGEDVPSTLSTTLDPSSVKIAHRPYYCRVEGCGKKYKNLNGLKYHAKAAHPELDFKSDVKLHKGAVKRPTA